MKQSPEARARIGRSLLFSAVTVLVLAVLFATGGIPVDASMKRPLVGALIGAAILDALCGLWFLRRAA